MKSFAAFFLSSILLTGCATVTPDKVQDNTASFDSTTPQHYDPYNSGVVGLTSEGKGILTSNGVERYNNLIKDYKLQFREAKGVELKENAGITEFVDKHGNLLFYIDQQHLVYFGLLNSWRRDGKDVDSIWDKAKSLVK